MSSYRTWWQHRYLLPDVRGLQRLRRDQRLPHQQIRLPGAGIAFPLPVSGRINKTNPAAMASGTYTDVLQVTLSW